MTAIPNSTATYRYLNQSEKWAPKDRPSLLIAEMDPEWRYNASRWMEKRAKTLELLYSMGEIITMTSPTMVEVLGVDQDGRPVEGVRLSEAELMCESAVDAWDAVMESRADSPLAWVRTTPLYQALVRGLPPDPAELETLAQRAKHYNWCAIREGLDACTCPAQDPP